MARRRREVECPREPIGLSAEEAAAFIGISLGTFENAVQQGLMPPARQLFGRNLWDADEIASAFRRLPKRQGSGKLVESQVDWRGPQA
jgi:hypothetical protein